MSNIRHGHIGLFVDDLDRSARFYRDILGGVPQVPLVLSEDLVIQHVLFDSFDIELVKQSAPVGKCDGPVNHLCFDTDDAQAEYQKIVAAGYEIEQELEDNDFVAYFFFRGPDYERIEMMQRKIDE